MSRLKRLIVEVHRRSLWQVLLIYAGGSWVVFEVVQTLTEGLGLPDWFPALALVLLIVLLPVVLATAFVQEGGPLTSRHDPTLLPDATDPVVKTKEERTERDRGVRGVLTWRNAIVGSVVAFALLGAGVTGYMGMRLMGIGPVGTLIAKGVLEERDRIILADFENHTTDSLLAMTATEAFRIDLSQSRSIWLAEPSYVRRVLERMERDPNVPLENELAREVAVREGLKAVIAGEINSAGAGYIISARLVAAETGETIISHRETADDSAGIISAIDRLSKRLRKKIGESLTTIRGNKPLAEVTTASLEALEKYTLAWQENHRGEGKRAIALYEEAIALDSLFAAAYRQLGNIRVNRWEFGEAVAAVTKAYELRDRQTEQGRYRTIGQYHLIVTGDVDKATNALRTLVEISDSTSGLGNLAFIYAGQGDHALAERLYRRALVADSAYWVLWNNLVLEQIRQAKLDEAEATLRRWAVKMPDLPWHRDLYAGLPAVRGDYVTTEIRYQEYAAWADTAGVRSANERRGMQQWARNALANVAMVRGKLAEAELLWKGRMDTAHEQGRGDYEFARRLALLDVWYRGATFRGLRTLEAEVNRFPLDSLEPRDRPYYSFARFYALAGELDRAKEYLALADANATAGRGQVTRGFVAIVLALAEDRIDDAIQQLRQQGAQSGRERHVLLAQAFERAAEPDSAIASYERYLSMPVPRPWQEFDPLWLALAYERLGDLYEQSGDTTNAIRYYGKLVELWKDADAELQPRVEAARRAMEALSTDA